MKTTLEWQKKVQFDAIADSGHTVKIDGPEDAGGENAGTRPMELMLMGVGGCTSFDVVNILAKTRQKVTKCVTHITARRAQEVPQVFEAIHIHFEIEGEGLSEKKVERAIALTSEKYCSASIMMQRAGVAVTHSFTLSS
ncbi:MAG: OsmC family protein [Pseudomonadota bacterium]